MSTKTMRFLLVLLCFLSADLISAVAQPCVPVGSPYNCSSGCTVDDFFLVGEAGTSILDSATSCAGLTGYDDRTYLSVTLSQGNQYIAIVSTQLNTTAVNFSAWIDFNNNNVFESKERVAYHSDISAQGSYVIISIPPNAALGSHRMRTGVDWASAGQHPLQMDPCNETYYGERQDYTVNIQAGSACSGQPYAGTLSGIDLICSNSGFTIGIRADSFSEAGNLIYTWISKPLNASSYTVMPTANINFISPNPLPEDTTTYGFIVTCPSTGLSDTSFFDLNVKKFYQCYCSPHGPVWIGYLPIDTVKIPGTTLDFKIPNTSNPTNGPGFAPPNVANGTATLEQGGVYTLRIKAKQSVVYYGLWIDYDHNSYYDQDEFIEIPPNTGLNTVSLATLAIPSTALTGPTGMRLIANGTPLYPWHACIIALFPSYRETQNFVINIAPGTPCTGVPAGGAATASVSEGCPNTPFTLTATGMTAGLGISYQWISAPAGSGAYTAMPGATSPYDTVLNQTAPTDYALVTTCANSNLSDTSLVVSVGQSAAFVCAYCQNVGGIGSPKITSLTIPGTTFNYTAPSFVNTAGYINYPPTGSNTTTLQAGTAYNIALTTDNGTSGQTATTAGMWIDYDQDGSFSPAEYTMLADSVFISAATSFVVPASAVLGQTRMRIRSVFAGVSGLDAASACSSTTTGVTTDFTITLAAGTPCTGTPVAGTASTAVSTVCPSTSFSVAATGFSSGGGMIYQWQSSPAGANVFTNISGATSPVSYITNQTAASDYRMYVSCGAMSDTTNIITVESTPAFICNYCTGVGGSQSNSTINEVTIQGTPLSNITSGNLPYTFFPIGSNTTATLQQSATYTITVGSNNFSQNYDALMWIDYDHSGSFDANESVLVCDSLLGTGSAAFTVPATALTGITEMRVRTIPTGTVPLGPADACVYYNGFGQTQDYMITLVAPVSCSGTPVAGTASASVTTTCPDHPFILASLGATPGYGISYQWQSSNMGAGSFTDIPGATAPVYTVATQTNSSDYRLVAICANGGSDTSNLATVEQTPFYNCYCELTAGSPWDASLDSVSIAGTTLDAYVPLNTNTYTAFPPSGNTTASLAQGATYTMFVNSSGGSNHTYASIGMWIDYDHSATFDANEYLEVSPGIIGTESVSFTVPLTAQTGMTGLRVRSNNFVVPITAGDPCTTLYDGQTEDFVITIDPGSNCTGTPVAGIASASQQEVCPDTMFSLYSQGYSIAGDIQFQWQSSPSGSGAFTDIAGATNPVFTAASLTSPSDFRMIITCATSGLSDTTNVVPVGQTVFYECYCSHMGSASWDVALDSFAIQGTTLQIHLPFTTDYFISLPDTGIATATLEQGAMYIASVTNKMLGSAKYNMWIDYDHNSVFDASEHVLLSDSVASGVTILKSFAVPTSALTGLTRLRVRGTNDEILPGDACTYMQTTVNYDFLITIDPATACTGTVSAGTAVCAEEDVCPDHIFTLSSTGYTVGNGIAYQWQRADPVINTYADIPGAVTPAYDIQNQLTTTNYRLIVTCLSTGISDTSNVVLVNENNFFHCYCSPFTGIQLFGNGSGFVSNISIQGTTLAAPLMLWPYAGGYTLIPPTPTYNTATLNPGNTYTSDVLLPGLPITPTPFVGGWIDYDQNGTYDPGEYFGYTTTDYVHYTASFTVPANSLLGNTGMRIINSLTSPVTSADMCGYFSDGTAVDLILSVGLCEDVTGTTVSSITGTGATVAWNPVNGALGYEIIVDESSSSPGFWGAAINTTDSVITGLTPGTTYYAHVRSRCGNGNFSSWITVPFTTSPTAVANVTDNDFSLHVFPNPAKDVVTVKVYRTHPAAANIVLTDVTGRLIKTLSMKGDNVTINMNGLASGIYLIRYLDGAHNATLRIFKQ